MGQSLTTIRTERPGFSVSSVPFVATNTSFYNSLGQLIRTTSPGQADTLYVYDSLGAQTRSGLDLNLNGIIDLAGPDRVTSNATEFVQINGDWYRESRSYTFPEDNSATAILTGTQRQRLTGLGAATDYGILTAETISLDLLGNQTLQQTHIDRDNAVRVGLVSTPDSTNAAISVTINGRAQYSISKTGVRTDYGGFRVRPRI
jgi:YD repeat-containing protein